MRLHELQDKQRAIVECVYCEGDLRQRLLEMGIIKGANIQVEREAPLGDPLHIKIKGYSLSLRKEEACDIEVSIV
ncbi:ferrous iron transport protein A [Candidatus Woesearchaeota archaeon]|nr:ferrous iron transport protein A [Candidatus Woesearchaeota archaeon]